MKIAAILCIFLGVLKPHFCNDAVQTKIVGGVKTTITKMPYLVNIRINGHFVCGGSLIAKRFVLTAAHCVKGVRVGNVKVQGGTSLLSNQGVTRSAVKIMIPKIFTLKTMHFDVAIIKLNSDLTGNNVATIPLCSTTLKASQSARISGWGLTNENAQNIPNRVRTAVVRMISKKRCISDYKGDEKLTKTMMCAWIKGVRDSCSGDSGGPLVVNGQVCGIVSWGIGCARPRYPGVYTSVNVVKSFILKALKQ